MEHLLLGRSKTIELAPAIFTPYELKIVAMFDDNPMPVKMVRKC